MYQLRVYISGLISKGGTLSEEQIQENILKFVEAERILKSKGYAVYSPTWHVPGKTWQDYMREDIKELMDCDKICPLEGWQESPGAVIEVGLAERVGIEIISLDDK